MDFLRFAIIYEEDGRFSIGFSIAEDDAELIERLKRADGFDRVCQAIPQTKEWVESAEPLTPVMGAGDIKNRWVHWAQRGNPPVLGLLHAGDSARETNPFYGRGCSAAFVEGHLVADALRASGRPEQRARFFAARVRSELLPYYDVSLKADRMFAARVLAARGARMPLAQRLASAIYMTLAVPAAFEDHAVARGLLGIQHMRPPRARDGVAIVVRMLYAALRRLTRRRKLIPAGASPAAAQSGGRRAARSDRALDHALHAVAERGRFAISQRTPEAAPSTSENSSGQARPTPNEPIASSASAAPPALSPSARRRRAGLPAVRCRARTAPCRTAPSCARATRRRGCCTRSRTPPTRRSGSRRSC